MTVIATFDVGEPVVITAGLSKGAAGVVVRRTTTMFGNITTYAVRLPVGERVIRADYLRRAA